MKLATLVYLRSAGKTLMLHRNKRPGDMHEGLWNGLGGKLEPGETPEECAVREVREETGLTVKEVELRGLLTFPNNVGLGKEAWYVLVYEADAYEGSLAEESPEGELAWIEDERLLKLPLNEGDYIWMEWLLARKFFSAKFLYKDRELLEWSATFSSAADAPPRRRESRGGGA